jgi:hypothetical protein
MAAFLHSLSGALRVAGSVAIAGAIMAAALLPSKPTVPGSGSKSTEPEVTTTCQHVDVAAGCPEVVELVPASISTASSTM